MADPRASTDQSADADDKVIETLVTLAAKLVSNLGPGK
jgi:hypothetical protein